MGDCEIEPDNVVTRISQGWWNDFGLEKAGGGSDMLENNPVCKKIVCLPCVALRLLMY